ncbi:Uncharacterized protein Adt_20398 [Abeliophyllum distichum]|uniref:Uncharacterized protein n=1 Tax=Abeliophyllum distichum TaxID=126358 RepID=A0ABD1SWF1_9LAMI
MPQKRLLPPVPSRHYFSHVTVWCPKSIALISPALSTGEETLVVGSGRAAGIYGAIREEIVVFGQVKISRGGRGTVGSMKIAERELGRICIQWDGMRVSDGLM